MHPNLRHRLDELLHDLDGVLKELSERPQDASPAVAATLWEVGDTLRMLLARPNKPE